MPLRYAALLRFMLPSYAACAMRVTLFHASAVVFAHDARRLLFIVMLAAFMLMRLRCCCAICRRCQIRLFTLVFTPAVIYMSFSRCSRVRHGSRFFSDACEHAGATSACCGAARKAVHAMRGGAHGARCAQRSDRQQEYICDERAAYAMLALRRPHEAAPATRQIRRHARCCRHHAYSAILFMLSRYARVPAARRATRCCYFRACHDAHIAAARHAAHTPCCSLFIRQLFDAHYATLLKMPAIARGCRDATLTRHYIDFRCDAAYAYARLRLILIDFSCRRADSLMLRCSLFYA